MILRPMLDSDIDCVFDIECVTTDFPWSQQQWVDSLQGNQHCTVAVYNSTVIGFAVFSSVLDEATLLNIAVSPDYQGRGYGRQLLQEGLILLIKQEVRNCYLEVRVGNLKAISLYRSMGFAQVGMRKNYYPTIDGREDALLMCLELPVS